MSHAHEDHIAGLGGYDVPVHVHEGDLGPLRSREVMVAGFGYPPEEADAADRMLRDDFRTLADFARAVGMVGRG